MKVTTSPSLSRISAEDGLEPLLELAAVLRTGDHRAEVERDQSLALQGLWDVAGHDPLGQTLDHGGLADARLADEDGVVLGTAGQHLHHPADLVVAADDRVEPAGAGGLGQVDAVLGQGFVRALRVGAGDPLAAADVLERGEQLVRGGAGLLEQTVDVVAAVAGEADQQVLGRDELIAELAGGVPRSVGHREGLPRHVRRGDGGAAGLGQSVEQLLGGALEGRDVDAGCLEQRHRDAVGLAEQRGEQVDRLDLDVAVGGGPAGGVAHRLLALGGQLVRVHTGDHLPFQRCLHGGQRLRLESVPLNFTWSQSVRTSLLAPPRPLVRQRRRHHPDLTAALERGRQPYGRAQPTER